MGTPNESGSLACGTQRGINGGPYFHHNDWVLGGAQKNFFPLQGDLIPCETETNLSLL